MDKQPQILIVDDEKINRELLTAMLAPERYQLFYAENGNDAIQIANDIHPDLILLDVMMLGLDGFEVCRRLKQDEKTQMIPIVMVTVLKEKTHRIQAIESGCDDFLHKPIDKTELIARVRSLLRIKSYHDHLVESCQEITEKNEKLRELERTKEGLTHMIIHDLNNPLGAISMSLELIMKVEDSLKANTMEILEDTFERCRDLKKMILDILDIYKMENGKLTPVKKGIDPVKLIDDILKQFNLKAEVEKVSLSFTRPDKPYEIQLDRELIARVLSNLLDNAVKHTPSGGKIEVFLTDHLEEGGLCFSVKDEGIGLEPEHHERIFEKFEQVKLKSSGIRVGSGGLGLAFCKMSVEAHGGKIWVEKAGKGSVFRFLIPK